MLAEMIKAVIKKTVAVDYPYLRLPAAVLARVDSVKKLDAYEIGGLIFYDDGEGKSCQGHAEAYWYQYKITVLDRFGNPDEAFPPLPEIKSRKQFQEGSIVAAVFLYGELVPALIEEVKL